MTYEEHEKAIKEAQDRLNIALDRAGSDGIGATAEVFQHGYDTHFYSSVRLTLTKHVW